MPSEYAKTLGARLRAIRTQQGLSLHGVEEKSRGRWKAVVVGSYERGDRSVTVQKLAELAEFYGVPVSELLPGDVLPALLAGSHRHLLSAGKAGPAAVPPPPAYPAVRSGSSGWPGTPRVLSASDRNVSASRSSSSASRGETAHGNPASAAARLLAPAAKNAAHSDSAGSTRGSSSQTLWGRFRRADVVGSARAATTAAAARSAAR